MVQGLITSFEQFETFALSEMAKQPEHNDPLYPFTPTSFSNRHSSNSAIKFEALSPFTQSEGITLHDLYLTPRRSNRIANQTTINYNENIPKKDKQSKSSRHRKQRRTNVDSKQRTSNTNRIKAIRSLFKKPNIGKTNPKSETKKRRKLSKMTEEFRISIPLEQINLLTTSVTKGRLKHFENVLTTKPQHSDLAMMVVSDGNYNTVKRENIIGNAKYADILGAFKTNSQSEDRNGLGALEGREQQLPLTTIKVAFKNIIPTENRLGKVFENCFSDGIFKSYKDNNETSFVDSSTKCKKLKKNSTFEEREVDVMQISEKNCLNDVEEFNGINGIIYNIPNGSEKLEQNTVNEDEASTKGEVSGNGFMEVFDKTQKSNNDSSDNFQMMVTSDESHQYLEQKLPKDYVHFRKDKTNKLEKSINKDVSEIKEQPLDLTIIDVFDETLKQRTIDFKNHGITINENEKLTENSTLMGISNNTTISKNTLSNNAEKCNTDKSVSIFDLFKENGQSYKDFTTEHNKNELFSMPKVNRYEKITFSNQAFEECTRLSDNLSVMTISDTNKKPENTNNKSIKGKVNPFDLTVTEVSEELENPARIDIRPTSFNENLSDNAYISKDDDDDFIDNKLLKFNEITEVLFNKYQPQNKCSSSAVIEILDENKNDLHAQAGERVEECPQNGNDKLYNVNFTEITNNFENPPDIVANEVEIYEESSDSEIEVIEETFLTNTENLDENDNGECFNKTTDNGEMPFSQGHHRFYQQEYLEIHQYNYLPFQNYHYPRYEYPIEENKNDYRPSNLSLFTHQLYSEFQIPKMHLDYNNYRTQGNARGNIEPENKLQITEYFESETEEKDKPESNAVQNCSLQNKTLQVQLRSNSVQNKFPILSQPPPIQFSSEQLNPINPTNQRNHLSYFQSQDQIEQICENSSQLQGYSDIQSNNSQLTNTQNSGQTSSEQREKQLYEKFNVQNLQHNERNQSELQIVQSLHQGPSQNIHCQQVMSENTTLSQIAHFVKNNCHIHDVKFGKIKTLNGKLYRTGSLLITFGDHYKVQIIGDVILNNIDDNIAFDTFFGPRNQF